jgi:aryl carrier-like protein
MFHRKSRKAPTTEKEKILLQIFAEEFGLNSEEAGTNHSLTDMGIDSIRVIRYKNLVQNKLGLKDEIPLINLLQNPSIEGLAAILDGMAAGSTEYKPLTKLHLGSSQAPPIFFFHPGLGEILVFLNLSKFFSDRRIYAIRAPGFNPGEEMHKSFDHMTEKGPKRNDQCPADFPTRSSQHISTSNSGRATTRLLCPHRILFRRHDRIRGG